MPIQAIADPVREPESE
jgi:hypothetical protein